MQFEQIVHLQPFPMMSRGGDMVDARGCAQDFAALRTLSATSSMDSDTHLGWRRRALRARRDNHVLGHGAQGAHLDWRDRLELKLIVDVVQLLVQDKHKLEWALVSCSLSKVDRLPTRATTAATSLSRAAPEQTSSNDGRGDDEGGDAHPIAPQVDGQPPGDRGAQQPSVLTAQAAAGERAPHALLAGTGS